MVSRVKNPASVASDQQLTQKRAEISIAKRDLPFLRNIVTMWALQS